MIHLTNAYPRPRWPVRECTAQGIWARAGDAHRYAGYITNIFFHMIQPYYGNKYDYI